MIRAFQWDLARQVEKPSVLRALLPRYAEWGYNELYLHLEDSVDYPSLPGVARRDALSWRALESVVAAASSAGIKVVPIVNLLGHTQYLIKHPAYRDLNELRNPDGTPAERGQICPLHPRTLDVAAALIRDVGPLCTAGKIHVGLDESFHLGKHPLSRDEINQIGLAGHFARYVNRLHTLTKSAGLRMGYWADMLIMLPEAIPMLPAGTAAYDWYYHGFDRHPKFELYNFHEYNLAPALKKAGVGYWGCPMNGGFRHETLPIFSDRLNNIRSWWHRCSQIQAEGMLITSWEPQRRSLELDTLLDATAAGLWRGDDTSDTSTWLQAGVARFYGPQSANSIARILLKSDLHPFAGYPAWEAHERWDLEPAVSLTKSNQAAKFLWRLHYHEQIAPQISRAAGLCAYWWERNAFISKSQNRIFKIRRLLVRGRDVTAEIDKLVSYQQSTLKKLSTAQDCAAAIWSYSRKNPSLSPNLQLLKIDKRRLKSWGKFLERASTRPTLLFRRHALGGAMDLRLEIHNSRPAAQQLVVQEFAQGTWRDLHKRFLIEFQSFAARPKCLVKRRLSIPLPAKVGPLRLVVRGAGQLEVSGLRLEDGVSCTHETELGAKRIRIGHACQKAGWVDFNVSVDNDVREISFKAR